jgi:hypothetical protein
VDTLTVDREFAFRIDDQLVALWTPWLLPNLRAIIWISGGFIKRLINL